MGRKSIKENKTRFQLSRENAGFTREGAAATLEFISADRIEKMKRLFHALRKLLQCQRVIMI